MSPVRRLLSLFPLAAGTLAQNTITFDPDGSDNAGGSIYTEEECKEWLSSIVANDADGSGGLGEEEFYDFLAGIEDPPYVKQYFAQFDGFDDLPWVFRVVHTSLSCHCQQLGKGENCCVDDAEIGLDGLSDDSSSGGGPGKGPGKGPGGQASVALRSDQEEYRDLVCQQISFVIAKSVPTPEPTGRPSESLSPSESPTPSPTASPVTTPTTATPTASPNIVPSTPQITESPTDVPSRSPIGSPEYAVFECTDAEICKDERPGEGDGWSRLDAVCTTDCPAMYDANAAYATKDAVAISPDDVSDRVVRAIEPPAPPGDGSGLDAGAVAGIVIATLALLVAMIALFIYRRRLDEQRRLKEFAAEPVPDEEMAPPPPPVVEEPKPEPEPQPEPQPEPEPSDDESSAPSVWSESQDEAEISIVEEGEDDVRLASTGSALAAVAAASTVATSLMKSPDKADGPGGSADQGHPVV